MDKEIETIIEESVTIPKIKSALYFGLGIVLIGASLILPRCISNNALERRLFEAMPSIESVYLNSDSLFVTDIIKESGLEELSNAKTKRTNGRRVLLQKFLDENISDFATIRYVDEEILQPSIQQITLQKEAIKNMRKRIIEQGYNEDSDELVDPEITIGPDILRDKIIPGEVVFDKLRSLFYRNFYHQLDEKTSGVSSVQGFMEFVNNDFTGDCDDITVNSFIAYEVLRNLVKGRTKEPLYAEINDYFSRSKLYIASFKVAGSIKRKLPRHQALVKISYSESENPISTEIIDPQKYSVTYKAKRNNDRILWRTQSEIGGILKVRVWELDGLYGHGVFRGKNYIW